VYVAPGTYTATLSVSDTNSSNSASTTVVIPAQSTLTVTLTADKNPPSGPRPTTVLFTATVTGNNTPVVRYDWSFSDGPSPNSYSTTSRQTTRVYDDAGTSTATVTATTSGGQTGSASAVVTVP
jgi:PKD repeat protein